MNKKLKFYLIDMWKISFIAMLYQLWYIAPELMEKTSNFFKKNKYKKIKNDKKR